LNAAIHNLFSKTGMADEFSVSVKKIQKCSSRMLMVLGILNIFKHRVGKRKNLRNIFIWNFMLFG
jgi:hypothetical protein